MLTPLSFNSLSLLLIFLQLLDLIFFHVSTFYGQLRPICLYFELKANELMISAQNYSEVVAYFLSYFEAKELDFQAISLDFFAELKPKDISPYSHVLVFLPPSLENSHIELSLC